MTTLLHIDASPRPDGFSRRVGRALADAFRRAAGPDDRYRHRDLTAEPVPHITAAWTEICDNLLRDGITDLDSLHLAARTPAQRAAWAVLEPLLDELVEADAILLATPMHNYSVPSGLKAWIDQVTFPKVSLGHRRFVVVASRGGAYGPGTPREAVEHQVRYLEDLVVGHFGVPAPEVVTVEMTNALVDPALAGHLDHHERTLAAALEQAEAIGTRLAVKGLG
ncbi:MAG TPA: NAD(P)H-dependent oxidoreductase [Acidimicrobiales bacterium]